jgi:hypothetical protein
VRTHPSLAAVVLLLRTSGSVVSASELKPETIRAWNVYIEATEARIVSELSNEGPFLQQEIAPRIDAGEAILAGKVWVKKMETRNVEGKSIHIPDGRIHHWIGTVLIENVELSKVLDWLHDCSNFETHFEEVERAQTLSAEGDEVRCFLRIRGKKVRAVRYHTDQSIRYRVLGPDRAASRTEATRIVQLRDAGSPREREMPEGNDSGYLWRWNSYWKYKAEGGNVIVECETISLSRSVPKVFWWFVKPFLSSVPKEYLESTLARLREAFHRAGRAEPR